MFQAFSLPNAVLASSGHFIGLRESRRIIGEYRLILLKKINLNSILSRLFISFLLVITPIIAVGIIMFSWEKQTIKSEIEKSALENVSFLQNNLENDVENIKLLQYNLVNDLSLKKLITEYSFVPKYDYYTMITDVQQRLQVMKNSNAYIQDIILYVPGMGHTISAENGYLDFDEKEYNRLLKMYLNSRFPLIFDSSGVYADMFYPLRSGESKTPLYLVEVVLSQDKIKAFLGKFSKYNESDTALYDYTAKNWLFRTQSRLENIYGAKLSLISGFAGKSQYTIARINKKKYYIISTFSKYLNVSFVQYVPLEDIFKVPDRYGYFLWLYAVLSVVIMFAYSFSTYKFVKYPVNIILKSFRRVEEGDLTTRVQMKAANEFNDLFEGFNKMVFRLNELIERVYKQELYVKKSEIKQLQSQINPHFLYNSYFMLHRMIKDNDINAEALSSYLGKYFQYITRNASDEVTLQREKEHAFSYARIQQMRFFERLTVEFGEIPEKHLDLMVPRMILQPILENSLEHGLISTLKNGLVRVGFEDIVTGLRITVEDSGGNLQDSDIEVLRRKLSAADDSAETTGIINVHRRLELRYGDGSGITVSRSVLGGLKVEIGIVLGDN